jgi:hypothetical protein
MRILLPQDSRLSSKSVTELSHNCNRTVTRYCENKIHKKGEKRMSTLTTTNLIFLIGAFVFLLLETIFKSKGGKKV